MNQKRRDEKMELPILADGGSIVAGLDIFFALFGDKTGRPHGERKQE